MTQRAYIAEGIFAEGRGPRQRFDLSWACLCRGPLFAEGSFVWPSAKSLFAECPIFGPRQSLRPSAKYAFPVVKPEVGRTDATLLVEELVGIYSTPTPKGWPELKKR